MLAYLRVPAAGNTQVLLFVLSGTVHPYIFLFFKKKDTF
jgi:hypothetical protein